MIILLYEINSFVIPIITVHHENIIGLLVIIIVTFIPISIGKKQIFHNNLIEYAWLNSTNLNKPAMKRRITGENSIRASAWLYTTKLHFTIYLSKLLRNSLRIHLSTSPIIPPVGSVYLDATNLRPTARNGFPSLTIFSDTKISRMLDGG